MRVKRRKNKEESIAHSLERFKRIIVMIVMEKEAEFESEDGRIISSK